MPDKCKVAIVGGGMAGSYLAMRLSKKYGKDVCLFDKDKHTGGRLYDIPVNSEKSRGPKIGIGGRRVWVCVICTEGLQSLWN